MEERNNVFRRWRESRKSLREIKPEGTCRVDKRIRDGFFFFFLLFLFLYWFFYNEEKKNQPAKRLVKGLVTKITLSMGGSEIN